ncbi:ABC transporter substrate-binding protein [Roseomonas fluvialis]|uniref:ABC transporter substrate-binding protein n=1 Tax=Roseomonas fluvialis TaxID=1750527 RepID=A0ABM7XYD4_9PROT|nr:ABC transporter substrate-binding protein [Roseomonas fluvialis]BDG70491.1 ABC transporter substrate-binding protein [Roseomonas fluvialis]
MSTDISRRAILSAAVAAPMLPAHATAQAETVLRVAMTVSDIPYLGGQPDQGGEGWRFVGITMFDSLIHWDLTRSDRSSTLIPGLALSWEADPAERRRWVFRLRPGVKFHDGSPFNADVVVWNMAKLTDERAPQYDPRQIAQTFGRMTAVVSTEKIDDLTVAITTRTVDALVPYYFSRIMMSSPAQWDRVGGSWDAYDRNPSGTGPYKFDRSARRERLELVRNPDYWDPTRIPKHDRLVLLPIPDPNTRVAALLSGQCDFIEAPPPDAIARLRSAGMQIVTNIYPHTWPWLLSRLEGAPTTDLRVRRALNLAIDRAGIVTMLQGLGQASVGQVPEDHPWFGNPSWRIRYDPAEARRLLAEAGYGPRNPLRLRVTVSPSGSGQMQAMLINEAMQQMLREVGVEVTFEVIDWNVMGQRRSQGAHGPGQAGVHGLASSTSSLDPDLAFVTVLASDKIPPRGINWPNVRNPEFDRLADAIRAEFDPAKQDALIAELNARMVEDATWLFVVHDLNPRAMSPRVRGFVQAQNWAQDLTPVRME